jgi:hypothetical protein
VSPWQGVTVSRPDEMRVGDAERDAVTSALHDHFAAGRLDREELDDRLGAALASKTHADLKSIVQDLPGTNGLEPARPRPRHPHHPHHWHGHQHHHRRGHRRGPSPIVPLVIVPLIVLAFVTGPRPLLLLVLQVFLLVWIVKAVGAVVRARSGGGRPR